MICRDCGGMRESARSGLEALMKHYIAIFVENDVGEWRAIFPDVPGCEAKGFSLDDAKFAAATALVRSEDWLNQNQVDLSKAVVTMIPLAA
jgi:hypothetical protein